MPNRFSFPIAVTHGGRMSRTYASVTGSILKTIREAGHGQFHGKPVCPPNGQFEIILYPGRENGLGEAHLHGKVRLVFSYPNLYLECFSSESGWHRFSDKPAHVVPGGVSQPLPFEGGYHNRGMKANFNILRFGMNTMVDIYRVLGAYPNNPGGVAELQEVLAKVCVLFPEAIRFPELRRFLIYQMKSIDTQTVYRYSPRFQDWGTFCLAIRRGLEEFKAIDGTDVTTFDQLLSLIGVLLHV